VKVSQERQVVGRQWERWCLPVVVDWGNDDDARRVLDCLCRFFDSRGI
jgi:hypothetical protein